MKTIDSTFESTLYPRLIHKTFIKFFKFSAQFTEFNITFNSKKHNEIAKSPFMTYARVNRGGGGGGICEYSPRKWAKSHTQKLFLIIFE